MTILFLVTLILLLSAQQLVDELTVQQTSTTESSLNSQQRPGQHKKWRVKINIFHAIHTSQTQQDSAMSKQADWFGVHRELNLDLSVIPSIFTSTQFPHSAQICFLPKDGSWPVLISTSIPLQRWTWDLHVLGLQLYNHRAIWIGGDPERSSKSNSPARNRDIYRSVRFLRAWFSLTLNKMPFNPSHSMILCGQRKKMKMRQIVEVILGTDLAAGWWGGIEWRTMKGRDGCTVPYQGLAVLSTGSLITYGA